jgi:hypothetical protein
MANWHVASIMTLYYTINTYISEVILHIDVAKASPSSSPTQLHKSSSWLNSTIRTDLLLSCLESLKNSLDWYANIPISEFERFTVLDLARLSYNLLLLSRLTLSGGPGFPAGEAQQTSTVIAYFDTFIEIYNQLINIQGGEPRRNVYWHMQRIYLTTRAWFDARVADKINGNWDDGILIPTTVGSSSVLTPLTLLDLDEEQSMCMDIKQPDYPLTQQQQQQQHQQHQNHHMGTVMPQMQGMQEGLMDEMMATWPMSIEGNVIF